MNLLFQFLFCLQSVVSGQVTASQDTAQKPEKILTVTVESQTKASPQNSRKKVEWKQAYAFSFLDEADDEKQMVFMVPTNLKMIRENYLGVFTTPVSPAMASQFSGFLASEGGLLVNYVHAKSPAAVAGCKRFDILVSFDKTKLKTSRQLRELVIRSAGNRRVEIGLIRTAKLQTIDVELAKRNNLAHYSFRKTNPDIAVEAFQRQQSSKIDAKLTVARGTIYAPVDYRLDGRVLESGLLQLYEPTGKIVPGIELQVISRTTSVFVDTADGTNYTMGLNTLDRTNTLKGSLTEIGKLSSKLPKASQIMVRRNLDLALAEFSQKIENNRSVKFHMKPRLEGKYYAMRLNLVHPSTKKNVKAFRCFELDHVFTADKPIRMSELLTLEPLKTELDRMDPSFRNAVVATLKKMPTPKVKVEIESSQ